MSVSILESTNDYKLNCGSLTSTGDVDCANLNASGDILAPDKKLDTGSVVLRPSLDGSGNLQGNAHLSFSSNEGVSGVGYITSSASNGELRFGANSVGAGVKIFAGSGTGEITVLGPVNASNVPVARGSYSWSGGGATLTVSDANVQTGDHIHVTQTNPGSEATAKFSHVNNIVDGVSFDVVLESTNDSNDATGNYMIYRSPA